MAWSFSHIFWRVFSSEATGNDDTGVGAPAWVWVDIGVAWAMAPAAGGSLQLSLWGSIVPSWLCVTVALCYGLRTEEVTVISIALFRLILRLFPFDLVCCHILLSTLVFVLFRTLTKS